MCTVALSADRPKVGLVLGGAYQPRDPAQRYFVEAAASVRRESLALFVDDLRISDYRNSIARLDLTVGLNLGMTSQLRRGMRDEHQTVTIETGLPLLPTDPLHIRGWLASWKTDQKNQLHIATNGWSGKVSWFESTASHYNRLNLNLEGSFQLHSSLLGLSGDMRLGLALKVGRVADPVTQPRRTGQLDSTGDLCAGRNPALTGLHWPWSVQQRAGQAYLSIGTPYLPTEDRIRQIQELHRYGIHSYLCNIYGGCRPYFLLKQKNAPKRYL